MALIQCPECGKDVSDMANSCPNCGFSIQNMRELAECSYCEECKNRIEQLYIKDGEIARPQIQFLNLTFDEGEKCVGCRKPRHKGDIKYNTEIEYKLVMGISSPPTPIPNLPKCTACGSTNLTKISTGSKVGKAAMFGIFAAGEMSKTWKCNNCGVKF